MNDSIKTITEQFDDINFTRFFESYIAAALWSSVSCDSDGITDEHDADDIETSTLQYLVCVAFKFYRETAGFIEGEPEPPICNNGSCPYAMAGHDFWLTSAGHGAGFWDGDWPKYGDTLTKKSKASGEITLYLGDNGKIDF